MDPLTFTLASGSLRLTDDLLLRLTDDLCCASLTTYCCASLTTYTSWMYPNFCCDSLTSLISSTSPVIAVLHNPIKITCRIIQNILPRVQVKQNRFSNGTVVLTV